MNVHELLGQLAGQQRKKIIAGAILGRQPGESLLDAALRVHRERAQAYEVEMKRLHEGGADYGGREGWAGMRRGF